MGSPAINQLPLGLVEYSNKRDVLLEILRQWTIPSRWTRGNSAVDRKGYLVAPKSRVACAFCVRGGVFRFSKNLQLARTINRDLSVVASEMFDGRSAVGVNDDLGFEDTKRIVLRLIDRYNAKQ